VNKKSEDKPPNSEAVNAKKVLHDVRKALDEVDQLAESNPDAFRDIDQVPHQKKRSKPWPLWMRVTVGLLAGFAILGFALGAWMTIELMKIAPISETIREFAVAEQTCDPTNPVNPQVFYDQASRIESKLQVVGLAVGAFISPVLSTIGLIIVAFRGTK